MNTEGISYIYLLQDGNDKDTQIYKIGRTTQSGGDTRRLQRILSYAKNTVVYAIFNVHTSQVKQIEDHIKLTFKKKYTLIRGSEWFQGDVKAMENDIFSIINENDLQQNPTILQYTCATCTKHFSTQGNLKRHTQNGCKGIRNILECEFCKKLFNHRSNKYQHLKTCTNRNNTSPNTIETDLVYSNETILNFNDALDNPKFTFSKDHISYHKMNEIIDIQSSKNAFVRYMETIMERPQNRMVTKQNLNTKYCKVYNNCRWEFILDKDAFRTLMGQIIQSALQDINKYKSQISADTTFFLKYLDDIRENDYENNNFKYCVERLKLLVVNLTHSNVYLGSYKFGADPVL